MWIIGGKIADAYTYPKGSQANEVWYSSDGVNWIQAVATNNIWSKRQAHGALVTKEGDCDVVPAIQFLQRNRENC